MDDSTTFHEEQTQHRIMKGLENVFLPGLPNIDDEMCRRVNIDKLAGDLHGNLIFGCRSNYGS